MVVLEVSRRALGVKRVICNESPSSIRDPLESLEARELQKRTAPIA